MPSEARDPDRVAPFGGGAAWRIRPMRPEDLEGVMSIERASFGHPWPPRAFLEEIRNPIARCAVGLDAEGKLGGYICFWIVADECAINNIAVAPGMRRLGLGSRLMRHALEEAERNACRDVWLEVRPSNDAARRLYETLGFRVATRRPTYYSDTNEDALVMHRYLESP